MVCVVLRDVEGDELTECCDVVELVQRRADKVWLVLAKLCCAAALTFGYSGDLTTECISDVSAGQLAAATSDVTATQAVFYIALWAEVFFGSALLYRTYSEPTSRFKRALSAWTALCLSYYLIALTYGPEQFVHSSVKETMFLAMSTILVELADQQLHLSTVLRVGSHASAVAIALTTMVPAIGPLVPMTLTSLYGVFAAALAGWAWKDRLSGVELFWTIYVVSLLYRIQAYHAGPEELAIYYALMNSKWVTLSACCRRNVKAAATNGTASRIAARSVKA